MTEEASKGSSVAQDHISVQNTRLLTTHVGLDLDTGRLITSSIQDEFTAIFVCLDAPLRHAGIERGVGDAHKITAYLVNPNDEPAMQTIFREMYPGSSLAWAKVVNNVLNAKEMSALLCDTASCITFRSK
ncbi:hypothetical protein CIB48_g11005 [Xylaria polymorpha]|nr:hypothetical protein CIB48_g11005 [Xylaria polymorpha]